MKINLIDNAFPFIQSCKVYNESFYPSFTFQPEWFFTQLLTWAKDHTDCLSTIIQPALWDSGYESVNANVEFLRCKSSHSV